MDWQGFYDPTVTFFPLRRLEYGLEEALAVVYWRGMPHVQLDGLGCTPTLS